MTVVHVIVPDGVDDPAQPSGGNTYDRRVCRGLATAGWSVHEHAVPGTWPAPEPAALVGLSAVLARIPDAAVVLVDGLVASAAPGVLVPQSRRLGVVVLVHLPVGHGVTEAQDGERAVLLAASAIIATSRWTRRWLVQQYAVRPDRVHVAEPGTDAADVAPGTAAGGELVCVAAVTPGKGHDVLLTALGDVADLPWHCRLVGSLTRDRGFVAELHRRVDGLGLADRVRFTGPLTGRDLDSAYADSDLLVLASRVETYGMVVTEALARGLPVVATDVGGVPEALGRTEEEGPAGLLVPTVDPAALASALRRWLSDADLRDGLRRAARARRPSLRHWSGTARDVAGVLEAVAA